MLRFGLFDRSVPDDCIANSLQRLTKAGLAYEFIAAGERFEQLAAMLSKQLTVFLIGQVGMDAQKLDVADQMRDAKLKLEVPVELHELALRREVVAADHSIKLCPERFDEDLAAATGRDFKDSKQVRSKAPRPHLIAVVFVSSFVHVQMTLIRNLPKCFRPTSKTNV